MAVEAFGAHFLTDAFSAGHVRTERRSIRAHWDARVPLFYGNFKLFLAEELAKELHPNIPDFTVYKSKWRHGKVPFTDIDLRPAGSKTQVEQKLASLPPMSFGGVVGLAIHDFDSDRGVVARVGGRTIRLAGDSRLFQRDKNGKILVDAKKQPLIAATQTVNAITSAVKKSAAEVSTAYALGRKGRSPDAVVSELRRKGRGVFPVEHLFPRPVEDSDLAFPAADAAVKWDYGTVDELLADHEVRLALDAFAVEKAKEFQDLLGGMGKAEQKALDKRIVARLTGGPMAVAKLLRDIIDYSPDTHGGIFGQKEDDRAIAYFRNAKREKAVGTLTFVQKRRLLDQILRGATVGSDDTTIVEILASKPSDAPALIRSFGWRWFWEDLNGAALQRFVREFGPAYWATASFAAKSAEVQFHASGVTTEIAEEAIIIILRTCSRDEVRAIDKAAGGLGGDLTGKEQKELVRLRGR